MPYYFPLQCSRADERGRRMNLYEFYKTEADIMGKYANGELVEVVRCKDCKHSKYCYQMVESKDDSKNYGFKEITFCSAGERKEVNDSMD